MIRWHPRAREEFREAIDYLITEASQAIAGDFAACVQASLQLIERHPSIGTPLAGKARRLTVRHFTYALIYRVHDDGLQIVALAHQHRRPGYWAKRR
ncbi:type II toxin-antitoxin system RelE/ParE family toxin [Uliginosibacterium sediminicola]|uniref:Type II toxin-antitoxin system RelE/ParE family toxin n=1 Tax=Uliginosibacterium sediminicola TaxID=2024550 RepID=A0ABU9YUA3_9RHOO